MTERMSDGNHVPGHAAHAVAYFLLQPAGRHDPGFGIAALMPHAALAEVMRTPVPRGGRRVGTGSICWGMPRFRQQNDTLGANSASTKRSTTESALNRVLDRPLAPRHFTHESFHFSQPAGGNSMKD
jgi:hypothetical protein